MSVYLARPVFEFPVNWADALSRKIDFDPREQQIGFGPEFFAPSETYTTNSWGLPVDLFSAADIASFEDFVTAVFGRLKGFWLPVPLEAMRFLAGISTTQFDVVAQDLAETWNERPDQHLQLEYPDGTIRRAQISGVQASGANERVTLSAALAEVPPAGTLVRRLHYVRFNDDQEKATFIAEHCQRRTVAVIELPLEYTNAEAGLQAIYLYHFWAEAPVNVHWYFTSFAAPVGSGGKWWNPWPQNHQTISETTDATSQDLPVEAKLAGSHPFSLFFPIPIGKPLRAEIFRTTYSTPEATTRLFTGLVRKVGDDTISYQATLQTVLSRLSNKLPRMTIGATCPYQLYDPETCKVQRFLFESRVTMDSFAGSTPQTITCEFVSELNLVRQQTADWFKGGLLETGIGLTYELRTITASRWDEPSSRLILTLSHPLIKAPGLAAGQTANITAGCDHSSDMCDQKFSNLINHASFENAPDDNLSLRALDAKVSVGGKK
jgi:uncharacterized phage protein (TIGR02218 family)